VVPLFCALPVRLGAFQRRDALDVPGLGEEVERADRDDFPALGAEVFHVACLGVGRAADVDDTARAEGVQLVEERFIATLAGRVDDHGGLAALDGNLLEDRFRGPGDEAAVEEPVERRVLRGLAGGLGADLDAVDGLEAAGPRQGEEAGAAVGVDEVLRPGVVRELDGVADELLEDGGVVLEELAG
jgi:hypothetical protein